MKARKRNRIETIQYFGKSLGIVFGIVLVWRGMWHLLDYLDVNLLNGDTLITSIGGIILGLIIIYLPDGDLKEIEKI